MGDGVADGLFLQQNVIALPVHGDVAGLPRTGFIPTVAESIPGRSPAHHQYFIWSDYRFVHELKVGDLVVYPSKIDRQIHIGEVTGKYHFRPDAVHPQTRTVKWLKHVPRTAFSQGAPYELICNDVLSNQDLLKSLAALEGRQPLRLW